MISQDRNRDRPADPEPARLALEDVSRRAQARRETRRARPRVRRGARPRPRATRFCARGRARCRHDRHEPEEDREGQQRQGVELVEFRRSRGGLDDREPCANRRSRAFITCKYMFLVFKDRPFGLFQLTGERGSVASLGDANRGVCPWPCKPREQSGKAAALTPERRAFSFLDSAEIRPCGRPARRRARSRPRASRT